MIIDSINIIIMMINRLLHTHTTAVCILSRCIGLLLVNEWVCVVERFSLPIRIVNLLFIYMCNVVIVFVVVVFFMVRRFMVYKEQMPLFSFSSPHLTSPCCWIKYHPKPHNTAASVFFSSFFLFRVILLFVFGQQHLSTC